MNFLNRLLGRRQPSGVLHLPYQTRKQDIQQPFPNDAFGRLIQGRRLPIWKQNLNPTPEPAVSEAMPADVRNLANLANTKFQATPAFKILMERAQPTYTKQLNSRGLRTGQAAGTYHYGRIGALPAPPYSPAVNNQQIALNPKSTRNSAFGPMALTHEALHSAFQTHPELHQQFADAYNQSAKQDSNMAKYLQRRTGDYAMNNNTQNFSDFNSLNPSMQTEVHSYLSEYPTYSGRQLARPLANYYRRWINPNQVRDVGQVKNSIYRAINPSRQGPLEYRDF